MECEGIVTKINHTEGYFEVDNKFKIHLSLLKVNDENIKLPRLQSTIKATNLHRAASIFVACKNSVLEGDFMVEFSLSTFIKLVKCNKLGVNDLLSIDRILKTLENKFKFKSNDLKETVTALLLRNLVKTEGIVPLTNGGSFNQCSNNIIADINVISISDCKYVDAVSNKFEEFPSWSFGVHPKQRNSILFGFMSIHHQFGFFILQDAIHMRPCIITNNQTNNCIDNSYVIIRDYRIITEIFKDSKVPNIEYLILDYKDIVVIYSLKRNNKLGTTLPSENYEKQFKITLLRKSTVCLNGYNKTEIYLEVLIANDNWRDRIFLILPAAYTTINLYLKEGFKYNIHHNNPLKEVNNSIVTSIENLKTLELSDQDAYFQEIEIVDPDCNKILPLDECKDHIANIPGLVSFNTVVRNRGFVENSYKVAFARTKLYGFTTPGSDTHTISFLHNEKDDGENLVLYLSNWMKRLMPLGLVPEMRINVKNVLCKSKYIKSTVFTSFEVIAYEPEVSFQTVNLFENYEFDWGPRFFLSQGNKIPHGVLVWSIIQNITIFDVKMSNNCKNCQKTIKSLGPCENCSSQDRDMEFSLNMFVSDDLGKSKVLVNNLNFLKLILDIQERQFSTWLQAFNGLEEFTFDINEIQDCKYDPLNSYEDFFKDSLTHLLIEFNKSLVNGFEIKCRKMFSEQKTHDKFIPPQWFYLDGRKSVY